MQQDQLPCLQTAHADLCLMCSLCLIYVQLLLISKQLMLTLAQLLCAAARSNSFFVLPVQRSMELVLVVQQV